MREGIDLSVEGPVARLTLNSPERHNALTWDGMERIAGHLEQIGAQPEIRVLVVTGAGDRTFCSGVALDQIQADQASRDLFQSMTDRLAGLAIPKIAALNGSAYGGGVEIGLCCDFRIGVTGMKVMVPAARFGLCYPPRGIQRYVNRLGPGPAKRLLVASEAMDQATLVRIGYLHEVTELENLAAEAERWAGHFASLAPLAVTAMLKMCDRAADGTLDEAEAQRWVDECNASEDLQEGLQAALDKRRPEFRGR